MGIKGTGDINPREVYQLCVIWCAEAARPFLALVDVSHQATLHPTVTKFSQERRVVSKDIQMIYLAIQQNYKAVLNVRTTFINQDSLQEKVTQLLTVDMQQLLPSSALSFGQALV
ncbi:hypothetical protein Pst134EA_019609 [Puccinia striiformis f. sp. tritici]|uniref:Uncharacterized protein n=1 Tax=Puccinia striiformis f. sp. tritici PST-78 TaxID=1165861 RepID=A0A0L0W1J0_9BASI|nr:hypothetical protein Pst134EA_019609 [Puccinia striiformis f. sp. tritici]KAH9459456.1 hypothetical protein Pst134EA_019609 [Puccinia striiformis f. sp. tritici]KNF05369.1 hypothetical protein PSTG_01582 [Puccinia striiformis f. sp. tritici PST-78]